jgi:hypothetical protein
MRQAVLAAALWFDPELSRHVRWANRPVIGAARFTGRLVMSWLDRRRERIDARSF